MALAGIVCYLEETPSGFLAIGKTTT